MKDKERILGVRVCSEEYGEGLDRKVTSENVLWLYHLSSHCHTHILIHTHVEGYMWGTLNRKEKLNSLKYGMKDPIIYLTQ